MSKVIQSTKSDTARKIAAVSSQFRAANPSISQNVDDMWPGSVPVPLSTVWSSRCGMMPYADHGKTLHPQIQIAAATFEASRIVTAYELGLKTEKVVTGELWKMRLCDLLGDDRSKIISVTDVYMDRVLSEIEYLVLCYAGSVAYARRRHHSVSRILNTFGEIDLKVIGVICRALSDSSRDFAQKESLRLARSICTKYELLINQVVAILLKKGGITWEQFQQVVKKAGYADARE